MVGAVGLEPTILAAVDFKSTAYANSATLPYHRRSSRSNSSAIHYVSHTIHSASHLVRVALRLTRVVMQSKLLRNLVDSDFVAKSYHKNCPSFIILDKVTRRLFSRVGRQVHQPSLSALVRFGPRLYRDTLPKRSQTAEDGALRLRYRDSEAARMHNPSAVCSASS